MGVIHPLRTLLLAFIGWVSRRQAEVIEYLVEENRVLKETPKGLKSKCLERIIFFGRRRLRRAVGKYVAHYNGERHQRGIDAVPVRRNRGARLGPVRSKERLGGLLRHYSRAAA